ncbi:unnamed protein product [Protopolystoma xenopodis]|uniref:Uncharacterized protein n=1 Tax=Protopolystoma xenopodis TaxID=117903 RepID=A0A448X867_9PLAT|nr:unnamed protein product [Protopolystoma xenopodis]
MFPPERSILFGVQRLADSPAWQRHLQGKFFPPKMPCQDRHLEAAIACGISTLGLPICSRQVGYMRRKSQKDTHTGGSVWK